MSKNTGLNKLRETVKYDKVWFKKKVKFPGSVRTYVFKIVEIQGKFYIYIDDRQPLFTYNGRTGPFNSYEESLQVLQEDLGSNFPTYKNILKNKLSSPSGYLLGILLWIIYGLINGVCFLFIDGGLNAIGIQDNSYIINVILLLVLNIVFLNKISKPKKE
jgi:hypothetical protein